MTSDSAPLAHPALPPPSRSLALDRHGFVRAAVVGFAAGFLSGMFGVGGGILIVPALVIVLGLEQRLAHGTSLAAVMPIAASGLIAFTIEGKVDWPVAGALTVGAVAGAVIGTHVLHLVPQRALTIGFALLMLATAARLLLDHSSADGRADLTVASVGALVVLGLVSGILAGLLGVGGGIIMVPAMVVLFGIPGAIAKGTSLAVILPTAAMGTWRNRANNNVALRVAAAVGLGGVLSGFPAGLIATRLDETVSSVLFASLLLVVTARMLWDLWRTDRARRQVAPATD